MWIRGEHGGGSWWQGSPPEPCVFLEEEETVWGETSAVGSRSVASVATAAEDSAWSCQGWRVLPGELRKGGDLRAQAGAQQNSFLESTFSMRCAAMKQFHV